MEEPHTIVEYFSDHSGYRCGYCGQKNTNFSHGMWAHQMAVQDYQDLIDRGWRRSGKTCYKPTMKIICCPHYTIRCHALDFKLNKSHKKQIKRVNRYLITGVKPGAAGDGLEETEETSKEKPPDGLGAANDKGDHVTKDKSNSSHGDVAGGSGNQKKEQQQQKPKPKQGSGPDPNKPKCRKAKDIRAEKKAMKMSVEDSTPKQKKPPKKNQEKTLEELLTEPDRAENPAHKLELRLVRSSPRSEAFQESFDHSHSVYKHYQMQIHKDPPTKPSKSQYTRFLCDSPLVEQHGDGAPPMGYGSFHQQYWLDGKIIAVGVIDILPSSVSSVYLYYDPDYSFLGLGVYSALREIMFVRELQRSAPALKYYYMGFYIHSCPKMRYKGQFDPSDLACPESYEWVPVPQCVPKLDISAYSRLSEEDAEDKDKEVDVNQVLVFCRGKILPYGLYKMMKKSKGSDDQIVKEYAGFVGKTCAERMFLVRQ